MKKGLVLLLGAGLFSASAFANTLDISLTPAPGTGVTHTWPGSSSLFLTDFQFEDQISGANSQGWQSSINLAGVNSISVTWNAPAGYMYVVTAPPADLGTFFLDFGVQYGLPGQAASLGQVTGSSISMDVVYGNPQPSGGVTIDNLTQIGTAQAGLYIGSHTPVSAATGNFAFTSITITANFSGTSPSGILAANANGDTSAIFFGVLYGVETFFGPPYIGPGDPGQLLSIEPLPSDNVPDTTSSLTLAGLSAIGMLAFGRLKRN